MSRFYFGGDSGALSEDDEDNLPYPLALPRTDFLVPDFDAAAYLSTLSDRHQTLEDLRSDLRERSQLLSKELLDLVNNNYEQFLSLGSDLKGGEEKVEDVRVGLLGFKRGVEDIKTEVRARRLEVDGLLQEKSSINQQVELGRKLLEIDARLEDLEERLMVTSLSRDADADDSWSESEDENDDTDNVTDGGTNVKKLQRLVQDYRLVRQLSTSVGLEHPFVQAQDPRFIRIRNTILLDLSTALKVARGTNDAAKTRTVKIMSIYRDMGEGAEAIKVLKDLKR